MAHILDPKQQWPTFSWNLDHFKRFFHFLWLSDTFCQSFCPVLLKCPLDDRLVFGFDQKKKNFVSERKLSFLDAPQHGSSGLVLFCWHGFKARLRQDVIKKFLRSAICESDRELLGMLEEKKISGPTFQTEQIVIKEVGLYSTCPCN